MDSLADILGSKSFEEPTEVEALRNYVKRRYNSGSSVKVQRDSLILKVPSHTLAASLHLEREQIAKMCKLTKKLIIRSGQI